MSKSEEFYFVVDIETAGPNPGNYSILSIGVSTLRQPRQTFYIELKPELLADDPGASAIHGLSLVELTQTGIPPAEAMQAFEEWIMKQTPPKATAVMAAFNAPFDWMFINDYFHRFLGRNPFGHKALDIKALYMGKFGVSWQETSHSYLSKALNMPENLTHHALEDAIHEAEILWRILNTN